MNASQTNFSAAFRDCLRTLDVALMRKLWAYVSPHLPQPNSDAEILATLHRARTQSNTIELKLRAYSHRWLLERSIPSGLPDELRQSAERMYPVVTKAVGISVNTSSSILKPIMGLVRAAMVDAVLEAHADGRIDDTPFIKKQMNEARNQTMRKLLGVKLP